jgi:hypothetical protein
MLKATKRSGPRARINEGVRGPFLKEAKGANAGEFSQETVAEIDETILARFSQNLLT